MVVVGTIYIVDTIINGANTTINVHVKLCILSPTQLPLANGEDRPTIRQPRSRPK